MNKETFEQGMEGMVGLEDERMEDVTRSTDQNAVLLVVGENRRKRARTVGEGNSMDKVFDRVKRKNPEDIPGNLHIPTILNFLMFLLVIWLVKLGSRLEVIFWR